MLEVGKRVVLLGRHRICISEKELPEVERGAVILRITRANVCGSELHHWEGVDWIPEKGVVWGHEGTGQIYKLGKDVETDWAGETVEVGDRVAPAYSKACGKCYACRAGMENACSSLINIWLKSPDEFPYFTGTFATHYYIESNQLFYKVPENVPDSVAASANCALSQVIFGMDKLDLKSDEVIVIQGAGGLGLNAIAVAKKRGADVIVVEGIEKRIDLARAFRADHIIDMKEYKSKEDRINKVKELTGGVGAHAAMEVTGGVPEAFIEGIGFLRKGGRYAEIGNISPGHTVEFDPSSINLSNITVIGVNAYPPQYLHGALQFLGRNISNFPFEKLAADKTYGLNQVEEAIIESKKRTVTRAAIVPEEE